MAVGDQDVAGGHTGIDTVEQREMDAGRDEQLAIGVADELGQLLAPVGRVDPDNRGPAEGAGCEPEQVVGDVVKQHADVRRKLGQQVVVQDFLARQRAVLRR